MAANPVHCPFCLRKFRNAAALSRHLVYDKCGARHGKGSK